MYLRYQIIDEQTGQAVCAVTGTTTAVSQPTLQHWAEYIAKDCDRRAAGETTHAVTEARYFKDIRTATRKLSGVPQGGGGNHGQKERGKCPICGGEYPLNKNGAIAKHGKQYGTRSLKRCAGSGAKPRVITARFGPNGKLEKVA